MTAFRNLFTFKEILTKTLWDASCRAAYFFFFSLSTLKYSESFQSKFIIHETVLVCSKQDTQGDKHVNKLDIKTKFATFWSDKIGMKCWLISEWKLIEIAWVPDWRIRVIIWSIWSWLVKTVTIRSHSENI